MDTVADLIIGFGVLVAMGIILGGAVSAFLWALEWHKR